MPEHNPTAALATDDLRGLWHRCEVWPTRTIEHITVPAAEYLLDHTPGVDPDHALDVAQLAEARQLFAGDQFDAARGWDELTPAERGHTAVAAWEFLRAAPAIGTAR